MKLILKLRVMKRNRIFSACIFGCTFIIKFSLFKVIHILYIMSLVRIINRVNGGKVLINLTKVSTIELKENNLTLNLSDKKNDNTIILNCDTRDEANGELNNIYYTLNKYYKSKNGN